MSLFSFLGFRRRSNYNRTPLTLADVLHRTVVSGLAALSVYGVFLGYMVHKETLAKGQGMLIPNVIPFFNYVFSSGMSPFVTESFLNHDIFRWKLMAKREAEARERELAQVCTLVLPRVFREE